MSNKQCQIIKDRQERFTLKRSWFVNAYRITDMDGLDLVQPWFSTLKEAKDFANDYMVKNRGYTLVECKK